MSSKRRNTELAKLARTHRVDTLLTDKAIFSYLSALDCPKSLAVWLLYSNGEHDQLVNLDIDPMDYISFIEFRDAYSAYSFLSKSDFLKLEVKKDEQAYRKFDQYEELCKQTNDRFRNLSLDPNYQGSNVWLLNATIRKIESILGDFSTDELVEECNWGPGVTTRLKGEHVSAINKFHSENGITRDLYSLVGPYFKDFYPLWYNHLTHNFGESWFNYEVGNTICTVPKNSKTDRVIAVEPGLNLWFQKGVGSMIRKRLLRWGIDLNHQDKNQQLAKAGSRDGILATVDFSSASDSISRELVREILPPKWFYLLNACRSSLGIRNKTPVRWEKFSSMGNGFTFELESLIFFSAALSVREYMGETGEISVFGDDVILPRSCYEMFSSFCEFLGFRVNKDKSFSSSYFRESCGSHYFDGRDVKPIYLKERLRNVQSIFKLANSIRWLAHRRNSHCGCDLRFLACWNRLLRGVPKPLRFGIPLGYGDSGLICNFDEATPARARHGIEGYYVSALVDSGITQNFEGEAVLLARLWGKSLREDQIIALQERRASFRVTQIADLKFAARRFTQAKLATSAHGNNYTLRGRVKTRVTRMLVAQWYNLGPWL